MSEETPKNPLKRSYDEANAKTEPAVEVDNVHCTGDFTLISSDGITFKTEPFYLQAASTVFRDAIAVGNTDKITIKLTQNYERSKTIRYIFNLVTGRSTPRIDGVWEIETWGNILRFCQKYDCQSIFNHAVTVLENEARIGHHDNFEIFRQAAIFGLDELCEIAIEYGASDLWDLEDFQKLLPMTEVLHAGVRSDPMSAPFHKWRSIPMEYTWSYQRAYNTQKTWEKRAREFRKLLKETKSEGCNSSRRLIITDGKPAYRSEYDPVEYGYEGES